MTDYTKLSDEDFEAHRVALYAELERRNKIKDAPVEVRNIAQKFVELGGDKADLIAAINEEPPVPENTEIETPIEQPEDTEPVDDK